tara:strand:+ start:38351 stop:38557 length:207 start_codon:yes stop_codon:yes gene_type:complete
MKKKMKSYYFVSYAHSKGHGRVYYATSGAFFITNKFEAFFKSETGDDCCVLVYKQISNEEYDANILTS